MSAETAGVGDMDGFLTEFVVYLGHRRYQFKLDGKEFTGLRTCVNTSRQNMRMHADDGVQAKSLSRS